jgi:hypothetical protein
MNTTPQIPQLAVPEDIEVNKIAKDFTKYAKNLYSKRYSSIGLYISNNFWKNDIPTKIIQPLIANVSVCVESCNNLVLGLAHSQSTNDEDLNNMLKITEMFNNDLVALNKKYNKLYYLYSNKILNKLVYRNLMTAAQAQPSTKTAGGGKTRKNRRRHRLEIE